MNITSISNTRKRLMAKLERYRASKKKQQRGFTLLEIIIVLGIIGVMAAGVVVLAQRAYDSKNMTDLETNLNSVRLGMKSLYSTTGEYPAYVAGALGLTDSTIMNAGDSQPIIQTLVLAGKIDKSEAKNNFSNDYFNVGGAKVGGGDHNMKGFFIEVNGLDRKQCTALVSDIGNDWDYVEVKGTGDGSGSYTETTAPDLMAAITTSILRSLANATADEGKTATTSGNTHIDPAKVAVACAEGNANGVILGSR